MYVHSSWSTLGIFLTCFSFYLFSISKFTTALCLVLHFSTSCHKLLIRVPHYFSGPDGSTKPKQTLGHQEDGGKTSGSSQRGKTQVRAFQKGGGDVLTWCTNEWVHEHPGCSDWSGRNLWLHGWALLRSPKGYRVWVGSSAVLWYTAYGPGWHWTSVWS